MVDLLSGNWADWERRRMTGRKSRGTGERGRRAALDPVPTLVSVAGDGHTLPGTGFVLRAVGRSHSGGATRQGLRSSGPARPFGGDRVLAGATASTAGGRRDQRGSGGRPRRRGIPVAPPRERPSWPAPGTATGLWRFDTQFEDSKRWT